MTDDQDNKLVPVWTLVTEDIDVPDLISDGKLTPERLTDLRTVLASYAESPIATLELHARKPRRDRLEGIVLRADSPLAEHLSQLITGTRGVAKEKSGAFGTSEVLYRLAVPEKLLPNLGRVWSNPFRPKLFPRAFTALCAIDNE